MYVLHCMYEIWVSSGPCVKLCPVGVGVQTVYMCQDDYTNVDHSHWRFQTVCVQRSADKVLVM